MSELALSKFQYLELEKIGLGAFAPLDEGGFREKRGGIPYVTKVLHHGEHRPWNIRAAPFPSTDRWQVRAAGRHKTGAANDRVPKSPIPRRHRHAATRWEPQDAPP